MKIIDYVENGKELFNLYGYWPTFHDGEIHELNLKRFRKVEEDCNSSYLEFTIHCWHMTNEIKNKYYVLENHNLITFRFEDIYDLELEGFGEQNAILSFELKVLETDDRGFTPVSVVISPANGIGGLFKAYSAEITKIEACDSVGLKI